MKPCEVRRIISRIAGEVAGLLRDMSGSTRVSEAVKGTANPETVRADWEAEELLVELLTAEGLNGLLITEERGVVRLGGSRYVVISDPLDGSKNYIAGIPWCSVSIAVADPELSGFNALIAGAVAHVFQGTVYSFDVETGAWIDGSKAVRPEKPFGMVLAYFEAPGAAEVVRRYRELANHKGPVRSLGSAALEIIYTALGKAEVFIDARARLRSIDVAAALGFARILGAPFSDIKGEIPEISLTGISRIKSLIVGFDEYRYKNALDAARTLEIKG